MDENLEDLREEFLKNGGHEITDAITVIKFMLSKGFSRRPKLDRIKLENCFNVFDEIKYRGYQQESTCEFMIPSEQRDKIVDRIMAKFTAPEAKQELSVVEINKILTEHQVYEVILPGKNLGRINLAQTIHSAMPTADVSGLVSALEDIAEGPLRCSDFSTYAVNVAKLALKNHAKGDGGV